MLIHFLKKLKIYQQSLKSVRKVSGEKNTLYTP